MTENWRLILPEPSPGPWNMAADEAILTVVRKGEAPPTLRFYTWGTPSISLGSAESYHDLDLEAIAARGWEVLRRASGGAAVLHQGQLGYSIVLPAAHPIWSGDLVRSYERLSRPLLAAFRTFGATVGAAPPEANRAFIQDAPALARRSCFGALGPYEIVTDRKKLVGNSQIRRKDSAVQHGVIQVSGGQGPLGHVMAGDSEEREALATYLESHVGSLEDALRRPVRIDEVVECLASAFQDVLDIGLQPGTLSEAEHQASAELVAAKYGNSEWTYRR